MFVPILPIPFLYTNLETGAISPARTQVPLPWLPLVSVPPLLDTYTGVSANKFAEGVPAVTYQISRSGYSV